MALLGLLRAEGADARATITVRADEVLREVSPCLTGACIEDVNHEIYGGLYSQMVFGESFQEPVPAGAEHGISGMWRAVTRGSARGTWSIETTDPFVATQSQRLAFEGGAGACGVENQGLNRWGLYLVGRRPYEGCVWVRAESELTLWAVLESSDGSQPLAEQALAVTAGGWRRLDLALTPNATVSRGRLALELREPGSAVLGYVFLQPGEWGRFRGLPVRRDVAEALIDQGITVLRYGGSMVNCPDYRWKAMIGPRDRRQPYKGTWYPFSSNGWGIPDFLAFCRAAGFECIPAFNMGETPEDMADFVRYANEPAEGEWGSRRAADGFPEPFGLRYIQLGNEERVDAAYAERFAALAEAIWSVDPGIILIVGDFIYADPITDPNRLTGAASGITDLSAHARILALAKAHNAEVWFDVHIGTEGPGKSRELLALGSYVRALDGIAEGARQQVVVFEFNAGNHAQRRALANAQAIHEVMRLGLPVATSANCLQPDGQNDNGWDQGLLFLNPSQVWLQPPGWVTRMVARAREPLLVRSDVAGAPDLLDVCAMRSDDGRRLTLSVVNTGSEAIPTRMDLGGYVPSRPVATAEVLAAPPDAVNTAEEPTRVAPRTFEWPQGLPAGDSVFTFEPWSCTTIRFE
jgi:hypothetical protein